MAESTEGIDIPALKAYHKKKGTITGFPGAKTVCSFLLVAELSVLFRWTSGVLVRQLLCQFVLSLNGKLSHFFAYMQVKFAPAILELPCDVLIPAALETQIHSGNAGNIKVSIDSQILFALQNIQVWSLAYKTALP